MLFLSSSLNAPAAGAGLVALTGDDAQLTSGGRESSDRSGFHSRITYTMAAVMTELKKATLKRFLIGATPKCQIGNEAIAWNHNATCKSYTTLLNSSSRGAA